MPPSTRVNGNPRPADGSDTSRKGGAAGRAASWATASFNLEM
jgi:hypothetical protein